MSTMQIMFRINSFLWELHWYDYVDIFYASGRVDQDKVMTNYLSEYDVVIRLDGIRQELHTGLA